MEASSTEVTFVNFAKILGIMRYRLGFTLQEYSEIIPPCLCHDQVACQKDHTTRGTLNLLEARSCLDWLGFDITPEDGRWFDGLSIGIEELLEIACRDLKVAGGKLDEQEHCVNDFDLVRLVRSVRERETRYVEKRLRRGNASTTSVPTDQLPELLSDLNVTLASPEVVLEASMALGLRKEELTMEDIMPVLWHVRRYQGLSQTELELAKAQFELCDEDGSGGMACCELEFAIRSLGFPVNYEEVQDELPELVAHYKKQELQRVLQNLWSGSFSLSASELRKGRRLSKVARMKRSQSELPAMLLSSGHCDGDDDKQLNLWGFSNLISEYRREINEEVRRNHGYTAEEVIELTHTFRTYDPDGKGRIEKRQLRRLLLEHCPQAERTQEGREQIAEMVKEGRQARRRRHVNRSGSIEFQEFLLLMRLVSNRCSREKLAKERAAVADTRFSVRELREFRKVFRSFARDPRGDMHFDELQEMMGTITRAATGARGSQELLDIVRRRLPRASVIERHRDVDAEEYNISDNGMDYSYT
eukprot:g24214.t1